MFCVGLYETAFGPALPFLASEFEVGLGTAGLLLTMLFVGALCATALIATKLHGMGIRLGLTVGIVLAFSGLVVLAAASTWPVALLGVFLLGVGDGFTVAWGHSAMVVGTDDSARAITRLAVWFALGAIAGPIWSGFVLTEQGETDLIFMGIAIATIAPAVFLFGSKGDVHAHEVDKEDYGAGSGFLSHMTPLAWLMGLVLFIYLGAEFGLGSWVSSYARAEADASIMAGALITAGYWGALGLGRIAAEVSLARSHPAGRLLLGSIAGAGVASLVLAVGGDTLIVGASAAFVAGLCFGPVWPVAIGIASGGFRAGTPAAMISMANAGGLLFPWLQGEVLSSSGGTEGIALTSVMCAIMFGVASFAMRRFHPAIAP